MIITAKGEAKLPILEQRWKATNTALDILTEIQQILRKYILIYLIKRFDLFRF